MSLAADSPKRTEIPLLTEGESVIQDKRSSTSSMERRDVGVDWLNLGFDLNLDQSDLESDYWSPTKRRSERIPGVAYPRLYAQVPFGKTYAQIELDLIRFRCFLRFNPSSALFGKAFDLVDAEESKLVVTKLLDALQPDIFGVFDQVLDTGEVVRAPEWQSQVTLTRVDAARNLYIDEPEQFKRLTPLSRGKHNPTNHQYEKNGSTWGLVQQTKQEGQERLYDKSLELVQQVREEEIFEVERNWFRFETQLQRDRLKKFGFETLAGLTQERLWEALEQRFLATGWGVPIRRQGSVTESLRGTPPNELLTMLGFMSMKRLGIANMIPPRRRKVYERMIRESGLTSDDPVDLGPVRGFVDVRLGAIRELEGEG